MCTIFGWFGIENEKNITVILVWIVLKCCMINIFGIFQMLFSLQIDYLARYRIVSNVLQLSE